MTKLPAFDEDGVLPPGDYELTLTELELHRSSSDLVQRVRPGTPLGA